MPEHRTSRIVGVLEMAAPDPERQALWELFRRCLQDLGHAENTGARFEFRWANGQTGRLPALAAELIALPADVLVTAGTPAGAAASRATSTVPIVMATGVALGTQLTEGAAQRNANVTGISDLPPGVSAMRLKLLREATGSAMLAILADRGNPSSPLAVRETQAAAREMGITVKDYWIETAQQFGAALAAMQSDGMRGFVVAPGALFFAERKALGRLAIEHRLGSIAARREYADAGCLMAYGAPIRENYRQAADYVARILRGAAPAELPVGEPSEFDCVVNINTAAALGLTLPPELLARAAVTR